MPRGPRIVYPGAVFHVINRFVDRHPFFRSDDDFRWFLDLYFKHASTFGILTYAYDLLPNHFHIVIETPSGEISRFLSRWLTQAAQGLNRRWGRVGRVFQGRTKTLLVENGMYFEVVIGYTLLNRVRAGLARDVFSDEWNSVSEMLTPGTSRIARPQLWDYLFGVSFDERREEHLSLAHKWLQELDHEKVERSFIENHHGGFLSSPDFRLGKLLRSERRRTNTGGTLRKSDRTEFVWNWESAERIVQEAVTAEQVKKAGWRSVRVARRHLLWYAAYRGTGMKLTEIMDYEGRNGRRNRAVSAAINRIETTPARQNIAKTFLKRLRRESC